MAFWNLRKDEARKNADENMAVYTDPSRQIRVGAEFPPQAHRARLARYRVYRKAYENKKHHVFNRAQKLLKGTEHAKQLDVLRIAVNLADILMSKPADMLVGEPVTFESGKPDTAPEQKALTQYVEKNDINRLLYEATVGGGIRGDSFIQTRFGHRQDFSALEEIAAEIPDVEREPIIESLAADLVFPEISATNVKQFKAIDIARVEYLELDKKTIVRLNVARHLPGYIVNEVYELKEFEGGLDDKNEFDYPVQVWKITELLSREVVATGVPELLVRHIPYKSVDYTWEGTSGLKGLLPLLNAINDRLTQVDYILAKHSDPMMYGPDLESIRAGGNYIPVTPEDVTPGYMTWNSQLEGAFKQLELLIGIVFQLAETPQWLFGTILGGQASGGTGTSHTDSAAIKARFMPILSKVSRIRMHTDRAIREALYHSQLLDIEHNHARFEAQRPVAKWKDGLPRNRKEDAEIMDIRTGAAPTIDTLSAIKLLDDLDDEQANVILQRIKDSTETVPPLDQLMEQVAPQAPETEE